jgi:hypothetical protein
VLTTTSRAALAAGSKKQKQVIKKLKDGAVGPGGKTQEDSRLVVPFAYFSFFFLFFLPLFLKLGQ